MPRPHELAPIGRAAPRFTLRTRHGTSLGLDAFAGEPAVLALSRARLAAPRERDLARLGAELRGLGAGLLVVTGEALWCFRPDDDLELVAARSDLLPGEVERVFAAYGVAADEDESTRWFVLDQHGRVRFEGSEPGALSLGALADALDGAADPAPADRGAWLALSRRELVLTSLVATLSLVVLEGCRRERAPGPSGASSAPPKAADEPTVHVTLDVNGARHELALDPRVTLLDALRERLGLTGTKKGCDQGQCGACTVLVDGRRVNACLTLAVMSAGAAIVTIEGLADGEKLHPLQEAFIAEDAFQCGYCTPGQILSAAALLAEKHATTDAEVREQMSGNLCRCGAYPNIVRAIQRARRQA